MKQFLNLILVFLFLLTTNGLILAQDFNVIIESTINHDNYFKPLKAGSTLEFKISVKNNGQDTCEVSIRKWALGGVADWISISNNNQEILPTESKNVDLTILTKLNLKATNSQINLF